jgi:hypothetical protein
VVWSSDYTNAFNTKKRSDLLRSVFDLAELKPLWSVFHFAYKAPSDLLIRKAGRTVATIVSAEGGRQGDNLMSVGYSAATDPLYKAIHNAAPPGTVVSAACLDDFASTGEWVHILKVIQKQVELARLNGDRLNLFKCKLAWPHSRPVPSAIRDASTLYGFTVVSSLTFGGVPIGLENRNATGFGLAKVMACDSLFKAIEHPDMPVQIAMLLLRLCALPIVHFLTRTIDPALITTPLSLFDKKVIGTAKRILKLSKHSSELAEQQLTLPVTKGGFGLRSMRLVAPIAFWSAVAAHLKLLCSIPGALDRTPHSSLRTTLTTVHHTLTTRGILPMEGLFPAPGVDMFSFYEDIVDAVKGLQKLLTVVWETAVFKLLIGPDVNKSHRARLISASAKYASCWRTCIPTRDSLVLSNWDYSVAACLLLGLPTHDRLPLLCSCESSFSDRPDHPMYCESLKKRSVTVRHDGVVKQLVALVREMGAYAREEPRDIETNEKVRPDALIFFQKNELTVDVSITHPCSPSYVSAAAKRPLNAARIRERLKDQKYLAPMRLEGLEFFPLVFETFGAIAPRSFSLLRLLSTSASSCPTVSPSYIRDSLSIALQQGNARVMIQGYNDARGHEQGNKRRGGIRII